jgi:hypothetical protein
MMEEEQIDSHSRRQVSPLWVTIAVLLIVVAAAIGYSVHQRSLASKLAVENAAATTALAETQVQLQALADKVNTLTTPPAPAPAALPPAEASPKPHALKHASGHRRHAEDPRFKKLQSQIDAQGKAIQSTREDLSSALDSAKTELNGSIARNHDELVLLQKRGERTYYEFDINKSKEFRQTGPVEVKLRKANTKHKFADLDLMVDDANVTQKHVNIYQPVSFYAGDNGRPVELVINGISKNHIHGYVSAPRYKQSELASSPDSNSGTATASQRQKLELPK